jgi:hypothetical protein
VPAIAWEARAGLLEHPLGLGGRRAGWMMSQRDNDDGVELGAACLSLRRPGPLVRLRRGRGPGHGSDAWAALLRAGSGRLLQFEVLG